MGIAQQLRNWRVTRNLPASHDVYVHYDGVAVTRTISVTVLGQEAPINIDFGAEGQIVGVEILGGERVEINGRRAA